MEEEIKTGETTGETTEETTAGTAQETAGEIKSGAQEEKKEEKPLDRMTAKELREIALEIPGIAGVHAMKKEELLVAIKAARGIKDEEPVKRVKKQVSRKQVSLKELKDKINELQKKKKASLEAKDSKMSHVYRRRINRLKKQTRRAARG